MYVKNVLYIIDIIFKGFINDDSKIIDKQSFAFSVINKGT